MGEEIGLRAVAQPARKERNFKIVENMARNEPIPKSEDEIEQSMVPCSIKKARDQWRRI